MIHQKAITLKQLRSLTAIVKAGNLAAAAEVLNVTAPAVSTQLRSLESNFGATLLERGPNGRISVTPEGEEILAATEQIEKALTLCFQRVGALQSGKAGHISLGVVSTGKYFAPGLVRLAKDAYPDIEITLHIGNREDIIEALDSRSVDIAIMGRPPRDPVVDADPIGDHPHVLIAPPSHPLVGSRDFLSDDLLDQTFLCRELGSGTRILMERFLDRIGEGRPYRKITLGTNETIKQAVIAGLGIAILSAHTVEAELASGRLATIKFEGLPIVRQWFLVYGRDRELSQAASQMRSFILGLGASFLPRMPAERGSHREVG